MKNIHRNYSLLICILLFITIWISSCSKIDTSNITTKYIDVVYANDSSTQKMDIYLPNEWKWPFPVIVAIHWWAFAMWNKTGWDISSMLKWVEHWYAVVIVDYRLSWEAIFPAAIDDVQKAILFIKNNAKKYNLNAWKIATWGDSAWWNLAALAWTKWNIKDNTNVQAVIDWFGPIYFSTMDSEFATLWITPKMWATSTANSPESKYLWKTVWTSEAEELVKLASPTTYITSEDPAFYIQHWTADTNIPITQSENFVSALKNVIWADKVIFEKLEWAWHGWEQFDEDKNLAKIFAFLDKYLK